MSRYVAIHLIETNGGISLKATGLPNCNTVAYTDLSPTQQLAAQLMVHAERLIDRSTDDTDEADSRVA